MFNFGVQMSSILTNTAMQSLFPLADYSIDDTLVKQSFFQLMINVM